MITARLMQSMGFGNKPRLIEARTFTDLIAYALAVSLLALDRNPPYGCYYEADGVRQCEVCDAYYLSTDPDSRTCGDDCDQEAEDNNRLHADDDLSDWGASDSDPYDRDPPQF